MGSPGRAAGAEKPAGGFRTRSLFGFSLKSDFAFTRPLPLARGGHDLLFTHCTRPAPGPERHAPEPVFRSPLRRAGESVSSLYRMAGREVLQFDGVLDFELQDRRIEYLLREPAYDWLVELRLLGPVMSYWMECRGLLCLHASVVAIADRAALFLAGGRGGKTTLAAALLERGHALLSDDIGALEEHGGGFRARPAYPEMRMWPDTARRFLDRCEDLPQAHPGLEKLRAPVAPGRFGSFHGEPLPLACIYLLDRRAPGEAAAVEIVPASRRPALIELVSRSFSPHLVQAAGLQPDRLERLGRLIATVPVRRLGYPPGHDRLEAVAESVIADMACT